MTIGYVALKPAAAAATPKSGGSGTVTLTPGRWSITGQLTPGALPTGAAGTMAFAQVLGQVIPHSAIVSFSISAAGAVSATIDVSQTVTVHLDALPGTFTATLVSPAPAPSANGWTRATGTINPGDAVRISLDATSFATILQSIPNLGAGKAAWIALLQQVGQTLTGTNPPSQIQAWAPGDALPTDWPADDTMAAQEYHAQFTYLGAVPLAVGTLPLPAMVWVKPGDLAGGIIPIRTPVMKWTKVGRGNPLQPGQTVRMAIDPQTLGATAAAYGILFSGTTALITLMGAGFPSSNPWRPSNLVVYAPGDTLPADWPSDDPSPATEYHAQFVYGGAPTWSTAWTTPSGIMGATLWTGALA
ncbi:MAG TPA: hypothetical protein VE987_03290 [Polyangiaceae bacterium]|nr:hypothetical protein [Polyangiaceae bacterium]